MIEITVEQNWREAKNLIISGNNFEYDNAVQHYINLKNKLFDRIRQESILLKDASNSELNKIMNNALNNFEQNLNNEIIDISSKGLNYIRNSVIQAFETGQNSKELQRIQQEIKELEKNKDDELTKNSQQIEKLQEQIFNIIIKGMNIKTHINLMLNKLVGSGGIDYENIYNFLISYLQRSIQWYLQRGNEMFVSFYQKTRLGGYYKEIIENKLIGQNFIKNNIPLSTNLIASQNTIEDMVLTPLSKAYDNKEYNIDEIIQIVNDKTENQFNKFGVQIKLRNLLKVNTDFMKISHQKQLLNQFNNISADGFNKYSWACGVVFLGKTKNILQSLGASNVMFVSGDNRYFMDDFIRTFRGKDMYLSFFMNSEHKITEQVGLQRYVSYQKNIKSKLLSKFDF